MLTKAAFKKKIYKKKAYLFQTVEQYCIDLFLLIQDNSLLIMASQMRLDVISDLEEVAKTQQNNRKFSPLDKHPRDSSSSGLDYDR